MKFASSRSIHLVEARELSSRRFLSNYVSTALAAIFLPLSISCGPSPDPNLRSENERLVRENQDLRRSLESAKEEIRKSKKSTDGLNGDQVQLREGEPKAQTGLAERLENPITFSDSSKAVEVQVTEILTGDEAVSSGRYHRFQLEDLRKLGKTIVYFGIRVTNKSFPDEMRITHVNFALSDTKNNSYACEQTRDYIRGSIHPGRSMNGGIAFAIYTDALPSELIFNTGLVVPASGKKVYASLKGLSELDAIKRNFVSRE